LPHDAPTEASEIATVGDDTLEAALMSTHYFNRIRRLVTGPPGLHTAIHVAEASALIVQIQEIAAVFGASTVKDFVVQLIERSNETKRMHWL
jgi:hypothetical protein